MNCPSCQTTTQNPLPRQDRWFSAQRGCFAHIVGGIQVVCQDQSLCLGCGTDLDRCTCESLPFEDGLEAKWGTAPFRDSQRQSNAAGGSD
jgi:hypothetical protein